MCNLTPVVLQWSARNGWRLDGALTVLVDDSSHNIIRIGLKKMQIPEAAALKRRPSPSPKSERPLLGFAMFSWFV
jgi:hypothetical protein